MNDKVKLMCGNIWDFKFLDRCIELNKDENNKAVITELYGSLNSKYNPIGSARPDSRIPDVDETFFKEYTQHARENGIDINYTINTSCIGNLSDFSQKEAEIASFLKKLENNYVKRVTVANPIVAKLVEKYSDLRVEISTIFHTEASGQLEHYKRMNRNVDKICMNIYKNRNFTFLRYFNLEAEKQGITVELMANEFCSIAGVPCLGLYRNYCYMTHSHGGNDNSLFDGFPIKGEKGCITSRIQNPSSYLKAPFILPQWYDIYKQYTGITNFKITGRTHTCNEIIPIVEAYTKGNFEGNLLDLWLLDKDHAKINISTNKLNDFIEHFAYSNKFLCDSFCTQCGYCDREFVKICSFEELHRPYLVHNIEKKIGIEKSERQP